MFFFCLQDFNYIVSGGPNAVCRILEQVGRVGKVALGQHGDGERLGATVAQNSGATAAHAGAPADNSDSLGRGRTLGRGGPRTNLS